MSSSTLDTGLESALDDGLDSAGWPYDTDTADRLRGKAPRPGFLASPFTSGTWRETLQALVNLPVGVVAFSWVAVVLSFGLGTVVTFIGLPVLAAALLGARRIGALERARASALLGLDVPAPAPLSPARPGLYAWIGAALRDGAGWRSVLYSVLMLPMGIVSFATAVSLWCVAIPSVTYPLWQWVYPDLFHQPGIELYENNNHSHYLSSVPDIAGVCGLGLVVLFVTPMVLRGLADVQRAMVRQLLSR